MDGEKKWLKLSNLVFFDDLMKIKLAPMELVKSGHPRLHRPYLDG